MTRVFAVLIVGFVANAAPVMAQRASQKDSAKKNESAVPVESRPPKGMCRIWLDNVPAAQQPAVTDCTTAIKNRPSHGRVLFGDDYADSTKSKQGDKNKLPPGAKGFTGVKPPAILPGHPPE
jgi:hypothetical protein